MLIQVDSRHAYFDSESHSRGVYLYGNHQNYWIQIIFVLKIILGLRNIRLSIQPNKLMGLVLLCLAFFSSGLVAQESKYSLSSYGDELSSDPDMPGEKVAFKDVDDIDLGDIPF